MGIKRVEEKLTAGFRWYGELVGRRPFPFLIVPLIFTLLVGPGLLLLKQDDDVMMLFTPYKAPSRREQQIARQFAHIANIKNVTAPPSSSIHLPYADADGSYNDVWFNVQVSTDDNIMTHESWAVIYEYVRFLYHNFTCRVEQWPEDNDKDQIEVAHKKDNRENEPKLLRFNPDFCTKQGGCLQMDEIVAQLRGFFNLTDFGRKEHAKIKLTYPVMYVYDRAVNWAQFVYGVQYNKTTGILESARIVNLFFQLQMDSGDWRKELAAKSCVRQLADATLTFSNRDEVVRAGLKLAPVSEQLIADEVNKIKTNMAPSLAVTILLITLVIAATSFKRRYAKLTFFGAGMGVLTVGLSLLSSFGFLCLCGVHMNFVVSIVPFLVLCVGIDNDFLLTSSWRQSGAHHKSVAARLGWAFGECGPSLSITSVNDILCFGVGYLSETPAVADFCLHTCVALIFRFIYQMTFFAAIVVYIGRAETKIDENNNFSSEPKPTFAQKFWSKFSRATVGCSSAPPLPQKIIPISISLTFDDGIKYLHKNPLSNFNFWISKEKRPSLTPSDDTTFSSDSVGEPNLHSENRMHVFFRDRYAPFLMKRTVKVTTCIIYFAYVVAVIFGVATWKMDITPQKLFGDDSILRPVFVKSERNVFVESIMGFVYVTKVPDFRYKSNVDRFLNFVDAMEKADISAGVADVQSNGTRSDAQTRRDTTTLWLRPYVDFLQYVRSVDDDEYHEDFYDYTGMFLENPDYASFINDVRFKYFANDTSKIEMDKFKFTVYYYRPSGRPFTHEDHVRALLAWRGVCANFSEYEAVVYESTHMNGYYDQRLTLAPTCLQTMGIAFSAMSIVTALLMPDVRSIFFICLSFLSVDAGVIAGLNMWGCALDPTSVAYVLMTIGFSVYYTARVCYCYQSADRSMSSEEKMRHTMEAVGWPILQGGLATLIGILPSVTLKSYMIRAFCRTVSLVVVIGLAHGLIVMPILMSSLDNGNDSKKSERLRDARKSRKLRSNERLSESSTSTDCAV